MMITKQLQIFNKLNKLLNKLIPQMTQSQRNKVLFCKKKSHKVKY